jgi:hypothetical protein
MVSFMRILMTASKPGQDGKQYSTELLMMGKNDARNM